MHAPARRQLSGSSAGLLTGLLASLLGGALLGCVVHHHDHPPRVVTLPPGHVKTYGPPAHAPAHGYRRKHQHDGIELVYDADVEVYVVVGREAVYWDGTRYLRWVDGAWQAGVRIDGVWVTIASRDVPRALVAKHKHRSQKARKRGSGRGVPARHAD